MGDPGCKIKGRQARRAPCLASLLRTWEPDPQRTWAPRSQRLPQESMS